MEIGGRQCMLESIEEIEVVYVDAEPGVIGDDLAALTQPIRRLYRYGNNDHNFWIKCQVQVYILLLMQMEI